MMEDLKHKLERIMTSPYLEGSDLQWWKTIQLKLGGSKQIQLTDTVEQALEKLKAEGIEE